jgi:integrase/recombinase XerD
MSDLRNNLKTYLAVRRALGFKLAAAGRLLEAFVDYAEREGARFVTRDLALRWATQPTECQPARWGCRLDLIRWFAEYQRAADPRTEIPPLGLLRHHYCRRQPYIYSDDDIKQLIGAAKQLRSPRGLRASTCSTLFGLLAVTGMRVGEVLALDREDVVLQSGAHVRCKGKGRKERCTPLRKEAVAALPRLLLGSISF